MCETEGKTSITCTRETESMSRRTLTGRDNKINLQEHVNSRKNEKLQTAKGHHAQSNDQASCSHGLIGVAAISD